MKHKTSDQHHDDVQEEDLLFGGRTAREVVDELNKGNDPSKETR